MGDLASTTVSRLINAPREAVYRAYLDPEALARWLPPGTMTGVVHVFDPREGGAFSMSLVYSGGEPAVRGKTSDTTDRFQGRFARLVPGEQVVWAVEFVSPDPSFAGEMIVETQLTPEAGGTRVTIRCDNIPRGIRPEDNEADCRSTLDKLAAFLNG
ncbi:SRPBCC family protein [Phreatobacter stygius]|uniref:ATPase n=1 Tax=Phreatobacter stygius TaxID=1940610 RepID=A0A4D7B4K5_9HYPH|nr:SRPBCC family protein [Phreatobacter stygius]QCI63122.1 ATPase [Phreatobacter stygius]